MDKFQRLTQAQLIRWLLLNPHTIDVARDILNGITLQSAFDLIYSELCTFDTEIKDIPDFKKLVKQLQVKGKLEEVENYLFFDLVYLDRGLELETKVHFDLRPTSWVKSVRATTARLARKIRDDHYLELTKG